MSIAALSLSIPLKRSNSMNQKRIRVLRKGREKRGPIVYWMSRDQRVRDNWALIFSQELALDRKSPLLVIFCLVPEFLDATIRQYGFMLKGLKKVEGKLQKKNIPFYVLIGRLEMRMRQ